MYVHTYGISPHSTGLCLLLGPLPKKVNQLLKGTIWSTVPLPCFFVVVKSQRVAGQGP